MRVSVQVRANTAVAGSQRWARSVFADTSEVERRIRFDEMSPVGKTATGRPARDEVRSILFVVDTTNASPGASGRIWLGQVRLR